MDWTFTKSETKEGTWKTAETIFEDQEPTAQTLKSGIPPKAALLVVKEKRGLDPKTW